MNNVTVCLTPELIHQHELNNKIVVVVDIFRATSCMVTGMAHGVGDIYPVAEVAECLALGATGKIMAGERGGQIVDGFNMGNSPYEYMEPSLKGKSIAVSTTNGTHTIMASVGAKEILIGAFLNLKALTHYLGETQADVIIHCAGWKGTVNIEDTLFAGALIDALKATHQSDGDAALLAQQLFANNEHDLLGIAMASSHAQRLASFGVEKDLKFCLQQSIYDVVPIFEVNKLVAIH